MGQVFLEIIREHIHELLSLAIIGFCVVPGPPWVKKDFCHTMRLDRNLKAEIRILAELTLGERAIKRRSQ